MKSQDIIKRVKNADIKGKLMLSIDKELQSEFREFCKGKNIKMSPVVEELIRSFLEDAKSGNK